MRDTLQEEIQIEEQGSLKHRFLGKLSSFKSNLKLKFSNLSKAKLIAISTLGVGVLLLLSYGAYSYWAWNYKGISIGDSSKQAGGKTNKDFVKWAGDFTAAQDLGKDSPKTEPSPINGVLYSEEAAEVFMNRRPLAIMINNHKDARPQTGLPDADLIYEAVAEGGITRLLAIYHARDTEKIGPVRSARIYYIDWAAEFHAWYSHWGGAYIDPNDPQIVNPVSGGSYICDPTADSYAYINEVYIASLDQMWLGDAAYWRDLSRDVALEHTGYTNTQKLWTEGPKKYPEPNWTEYHPFETWKFKDDAERSARPETQTVNLSFWEDYTNYDVVWEYDPVENVYLRNQGGQPSVDGLTGEQIKAKTVIAQVTEESEVMDKKSHLKYETIGSGDGFVFADGVASETTWYKPSVRARTTHKYTATNKEVNFNRGQIWVEIIPKKELITFN